MEHEELSRDRQPGEDFAATARRRGIFGARKKEKKGRRKWQNGRKTQERTDCSKHSRRQEKREQQRSGWRKEKGSWKEEKEPRKLSVTGAFRPDGLVFTRPCKIFQAKVFKEKKT